MSKLIISPLAIVPMERNRFLDGLPDLGIQSLMRLHNGRTTLFRHINGMDGQFILLENHPSWMPVNDADFNHAAPLPDGLAVHEESFYPFEK